MQNTSFSAVAFALSTVITSLSAQAAEYQQWHKVELSFLGPHADEGSETNPFTDFRLDVEFQHAKSKYKIRGFFAADGNAAESSATAGNVWCVRFSPEHLGTWTYRARMVSGKDVAIDESSPATEIQLENSSGTFEVVAPTSVNQDLRTRGRIVADGKYYRFLNTDEYWLKGGSDSPENLLAYEDFDGTYRMSTQVTEGEAQPTEALHRYASHVADWQERDPTWQGTKGKGIIGGINYLASMGLNSAYFLTLNIGGDGKDVWPYRSPSEFDRFDCSRLEQWEIVFSHMQQRGIALHVVTQETENERLLDDGNTGRLRQIYYGELIARFAHHPGLVWNLGEENGPADFSPNGQTADQQKAMASYIKQRDPYDHPVVIHTHSTAEGKEEVLHDLLGHEDLDGLSFQVDNPERVNSELIQWQRLAVQAGRPWMIGMDEIGPWHTGVVPDSDDPNHDQLRRDVLWGSLLAGANGVEWYFGAKFPHNDLTSEDWRQRANMWKQTTIAREFFENHLPYWEMEPANMLISNGDFHCFAKPKRIYVVYVTALHELDPPKIDLSGIPQSTTFTVKWFSPTQGGELQDGGVREIQGGGVQSIGTPPSVDQDWVSLIKVR